MTPSGECTPIERRQAPPSRVHGLAADRSGVVGVFWLIAADHAPGPAAAAGRSARRAPNEFDPPGGPPAGPTVRGFSLGLSEDGIPRSDSVHGQLVAWCRDIEWVVTRVAAAWDRYQLDWASSTPPT